jgi:isoquinoline 1-oxidoreductase beta subunit
VEAQVQGSVAYGLGAAFFQEITIKDGRVVETNFDTLEMMRMADFPRVETVIASSGGFWGGVGEPTISVASPAVMNAIFAATGKPVRSLPMKDVKLQRA